MKPGGIAGDSQAERRQEIMTRDELAEIIKHAIEQLGFARIPTSTIVEVFAPEGQPSITVHNALEGFASTQGWDHQHSENEVFFYPQGSVPPKGIE